MIKKKKWKHIFLLLIIISLIFTGCDSIPSGEVDIEEYEISGTVLNNEEQTLDNYDGIIINIQGDEETKSVIPDENGKWSDTVKGKVNITPTAEDYSFEPSSYDDIAEDKDNLDFAVTLRKVTEVEINYGRELIYVARERGGETEYLFEAEVLDQKGNPMDNEEIEWELVGAPETGVYIDETSDNNAEITVYWDAVPKEFEIIAVSKSNSDISASMVVNMAYLSIREENVYKNAFENLDDKIDNLNLAEVKEDFKLPENVEGYDNATGENIKFDIIWNADDHTALKIEGFTAVVEQGYEDIVGSINAFIQPAEGESLTQNVEDPRQKDYEVTVFSLDKDLDGLFYNVSIRPDQPGQVEVLLQDINRDSVEFWMHERNDQNDKDYLDNINNIKAKGEDNKELNIELVTVDGEKRLRVQTEGHSRVIVSYNFAINKEEVGEITDSAAAFNNRAMFALPDIPLGNIYVNYDLPEDWEAVIHFTPLEDNLFQVEGIPDFRTDMLENVTKFGVVKYKVEKRISGIDYIFVVLESEKHNCGLVEFWKPDYGTTPEEEMEKYINLTADSLAYLKDIFGFWPGGQRYLISTKLNEVDYHPLYMGFKYRMEAWTRNRRPDVPHHITHAWNLFGPIFLREEESALITEGLATFYQSELTADIYNDDKWLGLHYFHYLCLKRAEHFDMRDKYTIQTYAQSHMQILALDRIIKDETDGMKNIDDLMSLLGKRVGEDGKFFYRQDLINAINDVTGTDLTDFYMDYLAGKISNKVPPVDDFIDEYREPFFKWLDSYEGNEEYGNNETFLRTMVLIQLEIGLHSEGIHYTEHNTSGRVGLYNLDEFRQEILEYNDPLKEEDVVETLSSITGVDQSDFFDFYTIGEFRPSISHIEEWLNSH